jgi:hypothetical protein
MKSSRRKERLGQAESRKDNLGIAEPSSDKPKAENTWKGGNWAE